METQSGGKEDTAMSAIKAMRQDLESRMESQRATQLELLSYLQSEIDPAIDLSLKVLSSFNNRPFTATPPLPDSKPNPRKPIEPARPPSPQQPLLPSPESPNLSPKPDPTLESTPDFSPVDESGNPLSVIRAMIAVRFLERVSFMLVESSELLKQLETDSKASPEEKVALRDVGGENGGILVVEMALRSMAEENGGVILEEYYNTPKIQVIF